MFADTRRCVLYGPLKLEQESEAEIHEELVRIAN
jgi:hypothetical protein